MREKRTKYPTKNGGFTLIELLLVIGIIAIMTGVLFTSLNAGQSTLAAQRSSQLIIEALREAQNNALGAKGVGSPPIPPLGGWGVHFTTNSDPILFADMNNDQKYEAASDVLVRTIVLDSHAPISAVMGNDIVFLPPNPSVYINGIATTPSSADALITVTGTYGGVTTKVVHINAIGSISVCPTLTPC